MTSITMLVHSWAKTKMPKLFCIWNISLALILVACHTAPTIETPKVAQTSNGPLGSETAQPLSTTTPSPIIAIREMSTPTETPTARPSPSPTVTYRPGSTATFPPITPTLTGDLATARLILAFFNAYNAGQYDAALALLDDRVQIGDCDFQANEPIAFGNKLGAAEWLQQRIVDRDQLIVSRIDVGDPLYSVSRNVVSLDFARRTSDTLRQLGYADGISKNLGAKVTVTVDHKKINGISLGPGFLSTSTCYSDFGMTP